ncbi:hypothetical protein [Streptomyces sp. NPDC088360]|uniref:hypothetical protein n=1 Tax=Streptomyces sp. NPDC088360 TaxID=3154515 RepID=UPI00344CED30
MPAPQLLTVFDEAKPRIEYRQFALVDEGALLDVPSGWPTAGQLATGAGRGVLLQTGGNDFYPLVQLEAWSAEPAELGQSTWDVNSEADFISAEGTIYLREWDGGLVVGPVVTGVPGAHRLRAYCRGRAAAQALIGEDMYYEGVEEWLLQVWPLGV